MEEGGRPPAADVLPLVDASFDPMYASMDERMKSFQGAGWTSTLGRRFCLAACGFIDPKVDFIEAQCAYCKRILQHDEIDRLTFKGNWRHAHLHQDNCAIKVHAVLQCPQCGSQLSNQATWKEHLVRCHLLHAALEFRGEFVDDNDEAGDGEEFEDSKSQESKPQGVKKETSPDDSRPDEKQSRTAQLINAREVLKLRGQDPRPLPKNVTVLADFDSVAKSFFICSLDYMYERNHIASSTALRVVTGLLGMAGSDVQRLDSTSLLVRMVERPFLFDMTQEEFEALLQHAADASGKLAQK